MDTLRKDLQVAVRMLTKNPGFTLTAVLTLALGIAINATMFSLVSAFLLRRPPVHDPDRVAVISAIDPKGDFHADTAAVSMPNYLAWRDASPAFSEMAAADQYRTMSFTMQRQSEVLRSAAVTPNYFGVLGVTPEVGRTFAADENQPGNEHVIILSHAVWVRYFGSDPSILHRMIRLNREDYAVVGVMPANFHLLSFIPQVWTPLVLTSERTAAARRDRSLLLFARLKTDATLEQARSEMSALARRAEESYPETDKGWGAAVRTLPNYMVYDFGFQSGLALLMSTVGFVLMIACANVSGLLLAKAASRRKELAIRRALGAGRLRIIRQLLTEGLLIALVGGATGLLLADWGVRYLRANLNFNESVSAVEVSLDSNVLIFVTVVSLACALLCALAPALNASRTDELPLAHVMTMPALIARQRYGNPIFIRLMSTFAGLALLLSAIGIYGLIAYSVGQRTHEIGIRMALGAKSQDVLRMILREGMKMTAIGGAIGLVLAVPLPKVFGAILTDLQRSEPWLYVVVPLAMTGVALLATYIPARRAARTDPMSALRQE